MTKGQWIEYTGSDEQIGDMQNSEKGFSVKYRSGEESRIFESVEHTFHEDMLIFFKKEVTHYLICNPHPLRDMIKRQSDTGQEVWIKEKGNNCIYTYVTTNPNWNIPNAEYSFAPFEEK